jgi:hypothetical protein
MTKDDGPGAVLYIGSPGPFVPAQKRKMRLKTSCIRPGTNKGQEGGVAHGVQQESVPELPDSACSTRAPTICCQLHLFWGGRGQENLQYEGARYATPPGQRKMSSKLSSTHGEDCCNFLNSSHIACKMTVSHLAESVAEPCGVLHRYMY